MCNNKSVYIDNIKLFNSVYKDYYSKSSLTLNKPILVT